MDISSRPTYVEPSTEASIASARSFVHRCQESVAMYPAHRRLVQPVLTPRFVPTCSNDLLLALGKLSLEKGVMIQSHLAEAHDQVKWVQATRHKDDIDVFDEVSQRIADHIIATGLTRSECPSHKPYRPSPLYVSHPGGAPPIGSAWYKDCALPVVECILQCRAIPAARGPRARRRGRPGKRLRRRVLA